MNPTLCTPDEEKSCFACCPPIRPAGYEHVTYRNILRRLLRENTGRYHASEKERHPITGFSCWALGYLDPGYKRIGCLLHPALHDGEDLRSRVDYGDKCRRETCPEAESFLLLSTAERAFWLHLTERLDSFSYSSRKENPLFSLLGWSPRLLSMISAEERGVGIARSPFLKRYPFFTTSLAPKANRYLLSKIIDKEGVPLLRDPLFRIEFERFSLEISSLFGLRAGSPQAGIFSHFLELEPDFRDFLRLHLHRTRMHPEEAVEIKTLVDREIERFRSRL